MRSFAIPAFISLNRPHGALDSKYNVAHSLKTTGEMDVTDAQRKNPRHRVVVHKTGFTKQEL